MIILGIETSCDETALALIETRQSANKDSASSTLECRVIQSLVHSQAELHSAYGGVFPTLAKREHGKNLVPLLERILKDWYGHSAASGRFAGRIPRLLHNDTSLLEKLEPFRVEMEKTNPDLWESVSHADFLQNIPDIDMIAVTEGPGLEPALWVGINFARVLGALWDIPIIPINHMEGHIVGSLLESDAPYGTWQKLKHLPLPAIALLISGGHTELVKMGERSKEKGETHEDKLSSYSPPPARPSGRLLPTPYSYTILGQTKDDAVGEAFDKAARLLGLPYPGGPHIARLAHEAYEASRHRALNDAMAVSPVKLPRPMLKSGDLDFSFSGLKTAVLYTVRDEVNKNGEKLSDEFKKSLALEFETAVADVLDAKLRSAVEKTSARSIIVGGGVAANHVLRMRFEKTAREYDIPLFLPSRHISGDNALMIALAGALDNSIARMKKSGEKPPAKGRGLRADGTKRLA